METDILATDLLVIFFFSLMALLKFPRHKLCLLPLLVVSVSIERTYRGSIAFVSPLQAHLGCCHASLSLLVHTQTSPHPQPLSTGPDVLVSLSHTSFPTPLSNWGSSTGHNIPDRATDHIRALRALPCGGQCPPCPQPRTPLPSW